MAVRAKFTCTEKTETQDGFKIKMVPVTCGSKENEQFFKYTPYGSLEIGTINPTAAADLKPGKQYYVDLTEAG